MLRSRKKQCGKVELVAWLSYAEISSLANLLF
jgi:hypothetical protein